MDHDDDNDQEAAGAWTSQGYTPLQDANVFMQNTPIEPCDDGDVFPEQQAVWFSQGVSGATVVCSHPGAFLTSALGSGDDDDTANSSNAATSDPAAEPVDYHAVAEQALSALEADYMATLHHDDRRVETVAEPVVLETDTSVLDLETDTGVPNNLALPEDREVDDTSTENQLSFADFSSHDVAMTDDTAGNNESVADIDVDAVRSAVQAIRLKDPPLMTAFDEWDRRQRTPTHNHLLIPAKPLRAFSRNTTKAALATANLSRSATIAQAIVRLNLLVQREEGTRLTIHVIGCDHVECETPDRIRTLFGPIARWLAVQNVGVRLRLIGPGLVVSAPAAEPPVNIDLLVVNNGGEYSSTASCHEAVYDEWLLLSEDSSGEETPDLVVAFNAGVWGYKEWRTTIRHMCRKRKQIPFVITAYTIYEAKHDFDAILDEVSKVIASSSSSATATNELPLAACAWEPELNPFASQVDRPTKSAAPGRRYRENNAWQSWCL